MHVILVDWHIKSSADFNQDGQGGRSPLFATATDGVDAMRSFDYAHPRSLYVGAREAARAT